MNWQRTRLKYLAARPIANGLGESAALEDESWPRYIRTTDFAGPRTLREETKATLPPTVARKAEVRRGDLLLSAAGTVGKTFLYNSDAPACYAGYLVRFRPTSNVDPRFVAYWTETPLFLDQIETGKVTSTIDNFSASKYQNLSLSVPDRSTQQAIADYLDIETARIDALIAKKQRMSSVLEEHEQAVLLDSLGDWRADATVSLRQLKTFVLTGPFGTQLAASEYVEGGVPVINPTHIADGDLKPEPYVTVPPVVARRLARHRLQRGDIVLGRKGDVGRSALIKAAHAGWICGSDSIAIRTDERRLLPAFLIRVLQSKYYRHQLASRSTGATMLNVNESVLLGFSVPAVDLDTQHAVVGEIDHALAKHAKIRVRLDEQLALLREHRQALITAIVTGELQVPGVAA